MTLAEMHLANWEMRARCNRCSTKLRADLHSIIRVYGPDAIWWGRKPDVARGVECTKVIDLTRERTMAQSSRSTQRAVQYLRMSTEHQRYSLENQAAVIAAYALDRGFEVVRTYSDAGKSGLTLSGRLGLQQLLSDALNPARDFSAILVLDVSRWGRFQDPDQAAHYEYICRAAGVAVAYCAEQFENDGGMIAAIAKNLKRVMAAEYSRELSSKVTRAKLQQARLGFRQGGSVGYGFRRMLVEEDGTPYRVLKPGQFKGVHTDRVRTVLGPPEEQAVVRRIFKLFLLEKGSFRAVAQQLNNEGVPTGSGRPWLAKRIAYIIRNELCVGTYTYNKTNRSMRQALTRRPEEEWVRVPTTPPVVSHAVFKKANRLADGERNRYSEEEMLRRLRRLLKRKGRLSPSIIEQARYTPGYMTYIARFGSISKAYEAIGYEHHGRHRWKPELQGWWTDEAILKAVRGLRDVHGYVSKSLLEITPGMPSPTLIHIRFGGLLPCYAAAGFPTTRADLIAASGRRPNAQSRLDPRTPPR